MTRVAFAIPGDLATLTGGYGYDRRVLAGLPACGVAVTHLQLPGGFPTPSQGAVAESLRLLETAGADVLFVDGLALGVLPPQEIARLSTPLVAMLHHPLGLETGLTPEMSEKLIARERAVLVHARHVVVTSATTKETLVADFAVPPSKITVAEPGVERATRATGSRSPIVHMLAVGSLVPRKGYDILIEALAALADLDWRLTIVGSPERDIPCAAALRAAIATQGLASRIELAGEFGEEALGLAYHRADLFVMSSLYEGYGMVLAEAMSHGLPIVATTGGAAAQTVPDAAALKVAPGDVAALRAALSSAVTDAGLRHRLAEASWHAGQHLPAWSDTAATIATVLHSVAAGRS